MIDWSTMVKERDAWVAKNFPPYPGEILGRDSVLGCIEEFGELAHAHLKAKQGIRGSAEEHEAAAQDAIGDMAVYLMGVMSAINYLPRTPPHHRFIPVYDNEEALLRLRQPIAYLQSTWSIEGIIHYLRRYCELRGWDFEDIVISTWNHVKQRDWTAHREAGAPREDELMRDPALGAINPHGGNYE